MSIIPGYTGGGRKRIGEKVQLAVPDEALERIDAVLDVARARYERVPRVFRSRQSIIRACIEGELEALEARVFSRDRRDLG